MHGKTTHWPTIPSTVDGSDLSILTPTAGQLKQRRPKEKERREKTNKARQVDSTGKTCRKKERDRKKKGENGEKFTLCCTIGHQCKHKDQPCPGYRHRNSDFCFSLKDKLPLDYAGQRLHIPQPGLSCISFFQLTPLCSISQTKSREYESRQCRFAL